MPDRRLASVRTIDKITPIEGADMIEAAHIGGWVVVVIKDEFSAGEDVVYFEIDTALPLEDERFSFLEPRGSKLIDDKPMHVLRTIRLRGVYSQGLILPTSDFEYEIGISEVGGIPLDEVMQLDKYEPPIPTSLNGEIIGSFFTGIPKTDAERVQNISDDTYSHLLSEGTWVATEKVDGSSGTFFNDPESGLRIASRNWELGHNEDQMHWIMADKYNLSEVIPEGWTVQAEVTGPGIQKNRLGLKENRIFVFRVLNQWLVDVDRDDWPSDLSALAAPVYGDLELPGSVEEAVSQVDGIKSLVTPGRLAEGVVWWNRDILVEGRPNFKAINNKYLTKI